MQHLDLYVYACRLRTAFLKSNKVLKSNKDKMFLEKSAKTLRGINFSPHRHEITLGCFYFSQSTIYTRVNNAWTKQARVDWYKVISFSGSNGVKWLFIDRDKNETSGMNLFMMNDS